MNEQGNGTTQEAPSATDGQQIQQTLSTEQEEDAGQVQLLAHGNDPGFRFLLEKGGIERDEEKGHFVTIVGRGGTGKSIFILQTVVQLLCDANKKYKEDAWGEGNTHHTAFYFSLEATPDESLSQLQSFDWYKEHIPETDVKSETEIHCRGKSPLHHCLRILAVPTPALDIQSLTHFVRQCIADSLADIRRLVAIVIDPLGGLALNGDIQQSLLQLKDLCCSHRVFLFLLVEDFVFSRFPSIEHFSQTVIHLEHDPSNPPFRRLHIQKARHQTFFPGFHPLDLDGKNGVQVYPSVLAQSRRAHRELKERAEKERAKEVTVKPVPFFSQSVEDALGKAFIRDVRAGSVIFLMGPPGTFKQWLATGFALSSHPRSHGFDEHPGQTTLYVSFKADWDAVDRTAQNIQRQASKNAEPEGKWEGWGKLKPDTMIRFEDQRNPILSPEEVLFRIRDWIRPDEDKPSKFNRAVIWGLRRLQDMPMFAGEKSVQFLETLVTLLRANAITSLLIDWPDIAPANPLPIVDLSQYVLYTRVSKRKNALPEKWRPILWPEDQPRNHVAMLCVQREAGRFHRDKGRVIFRAYKEQIAGDGETQLIDPPPDFEDLWIQAGLKWEQDPGLVGEPELALSVYASAAAEVLSEAIERRVRRDRSD